MRNVLVSAALTRSSASLGLVASYVDDENYIYAYHDGTNVKLIKVVATTETTLINAATAYSAGALLSITVDGTSVLVHYNGAQVGSTQTVGDAGLLTGTRAGMFSSDVDNYFDNFRVFARGTEGQYNQLNAWSGG